MEKSDRAEHFGDMTNRALLATALAALAIGAAVSISLTNRLLRPLGRAQPGSRTAGTGRLRRAGQGRGPR